MVEFGTVRNFNNMTGMIRIDGLYDGMLIKYYISGVNSEGVVQTYPNNAPDSSILFILGI